MQGDGPFFTFMQWSIEMFAVIWNRLVRAGAAGTLALAASGALAGDPLPSWNDSASKSAIIGFVSRAVGIQHAMVVPMISAVVVLVLAFAGALRAAERAGGLTADE